MTDQANVQCVLVNRPKGVAQAQDFKLVAGDMPDPAEGEIQVRNHFLSVEPAMRGWIADTGNYSAPVGIGEVMRALAAGEVITSRHPDYRPGDWVTGWFGWQEIATVPASKVVRKVTESDLPLSASLGILGINGVTALLALTKVGQPKAGDTVVVSTAAGAVGSAVGQIAKILGCRTVGIAGGTRKVRACLEDFGFDASIDYKAGPIDAALKAACPSGIDVYFDNVAGAVSDAVYRQLALRARVVVCGTASVADWTDWPSGPRVERILLTQRARMEGFIIFDHPADYEGAVARLAGWVRDGRLTYREDILEGMEACPDALAGLYRGENEGKRLIRLVPT
ncbi:NADP-dependent oxidoreductase [Xanthobacter versatilis]|uniref:NADP-dependent oxidoreductase n=1 Tax=Xanthobacter autotrophicus (strain ATCC BAA-1158 / Py2) TaxID=78245 RepID=UPI00372C641E